MEKKDFKKGQKAILLSLKNVDFRKTMDIDAATGECTVVKVGHKYITVEDTWTEKGVTYKVLEHKGGRYKVLMLNKKAVSK